MIVYRVLMAQRADRVVVIDKGKVVQTGSHRRLLRQRDSLYRVLFARQYGGDRLPEAEEGGTP